MQEFPRWLRGKESTCKCRRRRKHRFDLPESGRSPGVGNDNPPQDPSLENPWTEEPGGYGSGVSKSLTRLSTHSTQQYSDTMETTSDQGKGNLLADLHEQWEGQLLSWSLKAALMCSCFAQRCLGQLLPCALKLGPIVMGL